MGKLERLWWQEDYNTVRPHQGLGYRTPAAYAALLDENTELESALTTQPN